MIKYTTPEMDVVLVSAEDILMSQEQGGGTGDLETGEDEI